MVVGEVRTEKDDPNCTWITIGDNCICYPGNVGTNTVSLELLKLLLNSVLSWKGAHFSSINRKKFYLDTSMPEPEYVCINILDIPNEFIDKYKLTGLDSDGSIYFQICQGCYCLPQSGILANDLFCSCLKAKGFYKAASTLGLWCHKWRPIQFCLIIDDFGVKYVGLEHFNYLLGVLKKFHGVQYNMAGNKFAFMHIEWGYAATTASSVFQATYMHCFSNSSIHTPPNHGYIHVSLSPSPTLPNPTSHLILTLWSSLMLAANAAFNKLWGHFFTT
jgi:hypothetical protein